MRKRKVFRETVITVIVIAVITLDALKQCIKGKVNRDVFSLFLRT